MVELKLIRQSTDDERHMYDVSCIVCHKEFVYSGSENGNVKVWNHETFEFVRQFQAHDYAVMDMVVGNDELFTSSMDLSIKAWNLPSLELRATFNGHEEPVKKMVFDGTHLLAGDYKGLLNVWRLDGTVENFYGLSEEIWDLYRCPESGYIFFVRDRGLTVIEPQERKKGGAGDKFSIRATMDGRAPIYVSGSKFLLTDKEAREIKVLNNDPKTKYDVIGTLKGHEKIVNALAGWGDNMAVTGGYDNNVKLWDLKTCQEVASCQVPECVNAMATSPDGSLFIGCSDGYVLKMKKT